VNGAFALHLRRRDAGSPPGLTSWNGSSVAQRFDVYRNNVAVSLIEALAAKYPLIERLVGAEYFAALAGAFMRERMPAAPRLALYGEGFADFVEAFPPLAAWPYLADVARLEAARLAAYHAADAAALTARDFAAFDDLAGLRLALHPSLRVVVSRFAVADIVEALEDERDLSGLDPDRAQTVVVARPAQETRIHRAPSGMAQFLNALARGETIADAAVAAGADFGATEAFRLLVEAGLCRAVIAEDTR
jgi:hypothetical protein